MVFINEYKSSSQLQQCLSFQKPFSLLLIMVVVMIPTQYSTACPRMAIDDCIEYGENYDRTEPQQLKVLDAVEAQLSYINLADEGENNDQLMTLFRPGRAYSSKLSQAIRSLTKLILMKERLENVGSSGLYHNVSNTLFNRVASDACQWLEASGIAVGDCTDIDLNQVEQLLHRLNFAQALEETKVDIKIDTGCSSLFIDYCTWINIRVLNNCEDSSPYNTTSPVYQSLQNVCALVWGRCSDVVLCS